MPITPNICPDLSDAYGGYPTYPLPDAYIKKLVFTWSSVTTVTIGPGKCRDSLDVANIAVPALLTASSAAVGPNALDAGVIEASKWYAAWVISKADGTAASLLSLSATAPALPAGYLHKRRIGWVYSDASKEFRRFFCDGISTRRTYYYNNNTKPSLVALPASWNIAWQTLSLRAFVPPTSKIVSLVWNSDFDSVLYLELRTTGSDIVTYGLSPYILEFYRDGQWLRTSHPLGCLFVTNDSQEIDWRTYPANSPGISIAVIGWTEEV